ncbi:MAG TPA: helix-turn-helix domain-containing protein [Thermoplasmata archaeon]|nr:helix-turn-helix domain-containing protein [Thermoplasmata archaeon]
MPNPGGRLHELLLQHGVPERAARIYIAAVHAGPQTASELARVTAMHRVEAYRFIKQLEVLGLLRATSDRPMRLAALPPEALMDRWIRSATERLRRLEADRLRALEDLSTGLLDVNAPDPRKFTVLEGQSEIYRFLVRRIGTAKTEIFASIPGAALQLAISGGIDRAFRNAHERGVRIRMVTDVRPTNRAEVKHFAAFGELRHSPRPVSTRSMVIDRIGSVAYVSGPEGIGGSSEAQVAVWSSAPSFRKLAQEYFQPLWRRGIAVEKRLVELEDHDHPSVLIRSGQADEPLARLREIATLGMRATGVEELRFDLPDMIDAVGRQLGRQVSEELTGETPEEFARSLSEYYRGHAMGRMEVTRARPLTLKVTQCFACVRQSPEVGRRICPMMLKAAFESRLGTGFDVSEPDPSRHSSRGCLFTVTPT